jgi:hypothetical protein
MHNARWTVVFICSLYVVSALCGCGKEYRYDTIAIELDNYDNSGAYLQPAGASVDTDAYVLRINYASDLADYIAVDDNNDYYSNNKPTSISITVLQDFDSLHLANSSVAEYFIHGPGTTSPQHVVDVFSETSTFYPNHLPDDLWLMKGPVAPGTYSFVVKMNFDDGAILSDTTTVNLN